MSKAKIAGVATAWVAISFAAACAPAATASAPQAVAPSATASGAVRPDVNPADVRFLQHMIPHHAQALTMAALVPERSASDAVRLMAERIAVSQRDEIARMQRWLRDHGQAVPQPGAPMNHDMGAMPMQMAGMLTPAELEQLAATRGTEFDQLFLESMIRHHEGALVMVAELFGTPGAAQGSEMYSIASEVDADQRAEIARMQQVLGTLSPAGPNR